MLTAKFSLPKEELQLTSFNAFYIAEAELISAIV